MNTFFTARLAPVPLSLKSDGCERANVGFSSLTDEALFTRLGAGELEALGCLFQRYSQVVRRISARILKNAAEADDFVQDLFLFLQQKCKVFDGSRCSARSWIIQMAYHRAIERRRYLTARQFYSRGEIGADANQVVGIPTGEGDYSVEAVLGRNGLEQVLKELSEDQRETLCLHFFEGYTLTEISEKLGQPLGSVRHHYYRGLDKLRKRMFGNTVPVEKHREK